MSCDTTRGEVDAMAYNLRAQRTGVYAFRDAVETDAANMVERLIGEREKTEALATKAVDALDEVKRELDEARKVIACERGDESGAPGGWRRHASGDWVRGGGLVMRSPDGYYWKPPGSMIANRYDFAREAMLAADKATP